MVVDSDLNALCQDFESTGVLHLDYKEYCKKKDFKPMHVELYKPPPSLHPNLSKEFSASRPATAAITDDVQVASAAAAVIQQIESVKKSGSISFHKSLDAIAVASSTNHASPELVSPDSPVPLKKNHSIVTQTPSILVELADDVDSEENVSRLSVRGWELNPGTAGNSFNHGINHFNSEALAVCIPASVSLSKLVLWNCALQESDFSLLSLSILRCNIVYLQIDQNTTLPDSAYASLITDMSPIRHLTLRFNKINDAALESIAQALKMNRLLASLNLHGNNITSHGLEHLAESLKFNQTLSSMNLSKNQITDQGIHHIAKALMRTQATPDETSIRKKHFIDLEKRRKEIEDDILKKNGSIKSKLTSAMRPGSRKDDRRTSILDIGKAAGKGKPARAAPSTANKKGAAAAPAAAVDPKKAAVADKGENRKGSSEGQKGKDKDKKGAAPQKGAKKKDETKEENEEIDNFVTELTFEVGGVVYFQGNRSLANLNLCCNLLTEASLQLFEEVVHDQAMPENALFPGMYRLNLNQNNSFDKDNAVYVNILNLLNGRNPFNVAEDVKAAEGENIEEEHSETQ